MLMIGESPINAIIDLAPHNHLQPYTTLSLLIMAFLICRDQLTACSCNFLFCSTKRREHMFPNVTKRLPAGNRDERTEWMRILVISTCLCDNPFFLRRLHFWFLYILIFPFNPFSLQVMVMSIFCIILWTSLLICVLAY